MMKINHASSRLSLLLIFLSSFILITLNGCGSNQTRPDQNTTKNQTREDPRSARLNHAKQLLSEAKNLKQPQRNQSYLDIVEFLFRHQPGSAEYRLIETALNQLDKQRLTAAQFDTYVIASGRLYMDLENYFQALTVLNQQLRTQDKEKNLRYHRLRAQLFSQQQNTDKAALEHIRLHRFLSDSDAQLENLNNIWTLISNTSIKELENAIANIDYNSDPQLVSWQRLAILVKTTNQQFTLKQKLKAWKNQYPLHMVSEVFLQSLLKKRFELLIQPSQIAILLPTSGKLSKPANTIKNGLLAAHFAEPLQNDLNLRFYDTGKSPSIWPLYKKALEDGAQAIIGPLTKQHLSQLSEDGEGLPVPTLAFNQLSDEASIKNLYQFGLIPEHEAAQIANTAKEQGHYYAAVLVPDTAWGKRMAKAFENQWSTQGGVVVETQFYENKTHDFSAPIKALLNLDLSVNRKNTLRQVLGQKVEFTPRIRQDIDMIFLAAFPQQARQIPLQISYYHGENIPVYATSHVMADTTKQKQNRDLNGIFYTDMPWLLDTQMTAISRQTEQTRASYQRLFSLGVDTYKLIPYLYFLQKNSLEHFQGESGLISIAENGKLFRQTPLGTITNGRSQLIKKKQPEAYQSEL